MRYVTSILVMMLLAPLAWSEVPDDLAALVEAGDFPAAMALAEANIDEWEGDPTFDFNYGLAAIETGDYSSATFALERVLLAFPNEQRVRLELARAHFLSGNLAAAEREFLKVLETEPPPQVQANINAFLTRIQEVRAAEAQTETTVLFASLASGYDTNVNSATNQGQVVLPSFGIPVDLGRDGNEMDNAFARLNLGGVHQRQLSQNRTFDISGIASRRDLLTNDTFDISFAQLSAGYTVQFGQHSLRFGARGLTVILDTTRFQDSYGLTGNWTYQRPSGTVFLASLAVGTVTFKDDPLRDTNQFLGTIGVARQFGRFTHNLSLVGAKEPSQNDDIGNHNGRHYRGMTYSGTWQYNDKIVPFVRTGVQFAHYQDNQPVFLKVRDDTLVNAQVGVNWQISERLSAQGLFAFSDQDSNIDVFNYSRKQYEIGLTYRMSPRR